MRIRLTLFAALVLCVSGVSAASAQETLDCAVAGQSVCADKEVLALESERATLVQQLAAGDPQNPALANEQTWIAGLAACGQDLACYRSAYANHNETLRRAVDALPAPAGAEPPLEAPADSPSLEEQTSELDAVQEERLREAAQAQRDRPPREGAQVYVESGLPGWGFFTAIGVTLLIWWRLMSALGRHRRELHADEARLRAWRR